VFAGITSIDYTCDGVFQHDGEWLHPNAKSDVDQIAMKKVIIIAVVSILFCFSIVSPAQNKRMQFKGKVLDRETRVSITGANISISGTRRGASTSQDGAFSVNIYYIPVYVTVSHVGYETQKIWLDNVSTPVTVLLNPATSLLQEVEIKARNEPAPFFKDNQYAVLDYDVDSGLVYMLVYRFRLVNSVLLCKTVSGDTIARSGPLPFKPTGLFRDCMGNMHVLSDDSAYQVWRQPDHLELLFPVGISRFRSILPGCVASTDSFLFIRKVSPDGLVIQFNAIDRKTSLKKHIESSRDELKMKMLHDSPYDYYLLMMDTIPDSFETATYMQWLKKIIYKPNTSSLHKLDDLICVFNSADYTLGLYTLNGDFTSKIKMPVEMISNGKWTTEIYIDDLEHKAYTSFRKGGLFTVYRIDLNTGDLKLKLSAVHNFPLKIRVHKGFLFYLYDVPGPNDNKHLFRQKL
jgi:hypothetical protein